MSSPDVSALEANKSIRTSRAAELLLWARNSQTRLQGLPSDLSPQDLNEGYEIQLATALLRPMPHAGFKIGLTNEAAQRAAVRAGNIQMQLRMKVPEKGTRWMQINVVAERLADASVVWHGYIEDVTLRHQMAIELAKMNIEIEEGVIHSSAA